LSALLRAAHRQFRRRRPAFLASATLAAAATAALASPAAAARGAFLAPAPAPVASPIPSGEGGPDLSAATSVREYDEVMLGAIAEAFRDISAGRVSPGFDSLVRALSACTDQVVRYGPLAYVNLRHHAMMRLLDLGPAIRAEFESSYGGRAGEALAAGVLRKDVASLLTAANLYLPTEAGQRAVLAAADILAERGRLDEAAERLRQLLWLVPAGALRVDPAKVLGRLAIAARTAGDEARCREVRVLAEGAFPGALGAEIHAAGRRVTLTELLREEDGADGPRHGRPREMGWRAFGGTNARRFADDSIGDARALEPVWVYRHRTTIDPGLPSLSPPSETPPNVFSSRENPILPVFPVVEGGVVYFADRTAAFAVDAETGLTLWVSPFGDASDRNPRSARRRPYSYVTLAGHHGLLAIPPAPHAGRSGRRTLVMLDRATGRPAWTARAADGDADGAAFLAGAILTGPPVVVGDTVYVGGRLQEIEVKAYVVAFDAADGRLLWRTFLASGPEADRKDDVEPETPSLSESGGVLYVSTDIGVLGAVDARTGDPLWIYRPERSLDLLFESRDPWRDDPLAIEGNRLRSTLPGSEKIRIVFDRPERGSGHIGNEEWEKGDFDFLLGSDSGWVYLVGRDEQDRDSVLVAYHPDDPRRNEQWRFPVPSPSESKGRPLDSPLGRGLVTRNRVLFPTWKALYDVDRFTGRLVAAHAPAVDAETGEPLPFGNIVPAGPDRLLAAGPRHLVMYRVVP